MLADRVHKPLDKVDDSDDVLKPCVRGTRIDQVDDTQLADRAKPLQDGAVNDQHLEGRKQHRAP